MTVTEMRTLAHKCQQMGYNTLACYWAEKAAERENKMNQMRMRDAGIREQEWAQKLINEKKFPSGITYKDLLEYGVYDARTDEVMLTIKGVCLKFKVERG